MPLQDVSSDPSMVGWLRQAGHGHLLDQQHQFSNIPPSAPSPPIIPSGQSGIDPYRGSYNPSASFSGIGNVNTQSYNYQQSPTNMISSPTQFFAPHMNQPYLDMDIENMKRDPHTRVIQRPPQDDVVYRQRVFVKYLQPPTPPVSGAIIVREKQLPPPPPEPPLVIKRAPPPPPTPPPVIIRERPPPIPPPEPTTIINKIVPAPPPAPRQVIIEQYPQLPPKPQDVIIERWLPIPPRQRRILYERLPAPILNQPTTTGPIIVQHGQPRVRIHREILTVPGSQFPYQSVSSNTNINQILSQIGTNQSIHSTLSPSSLTSYNPYSTIQQTYGSIAHPQSNVVIMQNEQPNIISPSSYGMPLTCMCTPNSMSGLGAYGSGISTIPTMGYSAGQSTVFNVPENVPVDNVLRQLGIDPYSIQHPSDPHTAVSHVWNAASHANPSHSLDPNLAVSHAWNAAVHATDPNLSGSHGWNAPGHTTNPNLAVSHVWNAATHATDPNLSGSHGWNVPGHTTNPNLAVSHVWNAATHATDPHHNQHYPYPQSGNVIQSSPSSGILSRPYG